MSDIIPFNISDTELCVEIGIVILEAAIFTFYIMTTKRFFLMLNFGKKRGDSVESLCFSQKSQASLERDPLTIAMILLIFLSLFSRLFFELPIDIIKLVKGSQSETTDHIEVIMLQFLFHIP